MKFSVCTDMVFSGIPIQDSLPLVKSSGCEAFEFWGWWNKDIDALEKSIKETGLHLVTFSQKGPSLVDPEKREEYLVNLVNSIETAKRLNCKMLLSTVGNEIFTISRNEQKQCIIEGLKLCAPILEKAGIVLIIEPLNILVNHMGYYLAKSEEAFEIVKKVDSSNIKVLFDIYHQQITEGNLISNIVKNIDYIAHFHTADVPGRHDLGSGEINYMKVFEAIDKTGYKGYAGLEYKPLQNPVDSLRRLLDTYK